MEPRALAPLAARASTTGKYSGRQPAITALTATFSTLYSQYSRNPVGRMCPTTSSGRWLVWRSIASTRASVGSTMGSLSVQWRSRKSCWRSASLAGSTRRGVERSNPTPLASSSSSGAVRPSITSCITGRPVVGSGPSM